MPKTDRESHEWRESQRRKTRPRNFAPLIIYPSTTVFIRVYSSDSRAKEFLRLSWIDNEFYRLRPNSAFQQKPNRRMIALDSESGNDCDAGRRRQ